MCVALRRCGGSFESLHTHTHTLTRCIPKHFVGMLANHDDTATKQTHKYRGSAESTQKYLYPAMCRWQYCASTCSCWPDGVMEVLYTRVHPCRLLWEYSYPTTLLPITFKHLRVGNVRQDVSAQSRSRQSAPSAAAACGQRLRSRGEMQSGKVWKRSINLWLLAANLIKSSAQNHVG